MGMTLSKGGIKTNPTKCCYFPEHVVAEIISRLPIQSVVICKCVCKTWLKLVSSSHFNDLLLKNRSQYMTFILYAGCEPYLCEIERNYFNHHRRRAKTLGPLKPLLLKSRSELSHYICFNPPLGICNGLICLVGNAQTPGFPVMIYIWNPILGQYKALPTKIGGILIEGLGFGYCQVTNQYKALIIAKKLEIFELEVLTIGGTSNLSNTWRKAGYVHGRPQVKYGFCCFEGSIYWICGCRDHSHSEWICCFDIGTEKQRSLCPPLGCVNKKEMVKLKIVRDCLCIVLETDDGIRLWSMRESYGEWTKHSFVDLSRSFTRPALCVITTLWEEDKEILLVEQYDNLLYYDYKKRQYVELKTTIDGDGRGERPILKSNAYSYSPSFVPMSQVFKEEENPPLKMRTREKYVEGCFECLFAILRSTFL